MTLRSTLPSGVKGPGSWRITLAPVLLSVVLVLLSGAAFGGGPARLHPAPVSDSSALHHRISSSVRPGTSPTPQDRGAFAVGLTIMTPEGPNQPATRPVGVKATATPSDPNCTSGFQFAFNWGDGTPNTTDTNGTDSHYYSTAVANLSTVDVTVQVTDCRGKTGQGFDSPFFYPPVTATLSTQLAPASTPLIARNVSSLQLNLTVSNIQGGAFGAVPPYFVNWTFGDGGKLPLVPLSSGANGFADTEVHTFLRPASWSGPDIFTVRAWVTDRANGNFTTSLEVQLNGTPAIAHPPSGPLPALYLYAIIGGVGAAVAVVAVVLVRRRTTRKLGGKAPEEGTGDVADDGSVSTKTGKSTPASSSTLSAGDRPLASKVSGSTAMPGEMGSSGPPLASEPSVKPSPAVVGRPSRAAATFPSTPAVSDPAAPVPCIICGTPLPSTDAPCPRCSPERSRGVEVAPPSPIEASGSGLGPSSPPLPGLANTGLTPPPLQVAGPAAPPTAPSSPAPFPPTARPMTAHPSISYAPVAPMPEIEPLPPTHAPAGPEPGVDTTPVMPLAPRPKPERAASEPAQAPAPGPATPGGSATAPPAAPKGGAPAGSAAPFLFPVSHKALFETLVTSAPAPSPGAEPPTAPSTSSLEGVTSSIPAAPPSSVATNCMVCGGPLREGYCASCKMNWRE